ncbi:SGNH/GDSL hydrolase family protein [Nocardioides jishulii]|uniref:SGNH/GDSL hydrolase family protein n=1 Tax=Nocardioides jishulii TaxID=2575440 RepID=A0A4U2YJZ0_9ACTN|nr:SGNH/GDSL hydrolase family protein [Nocardioides jishulii]QCX26975.1 SGNH/GDSL hydrolase family protein [Nocardioides jishulii]TKI61458.1 SGNH/GDSL hydrolase family protein [Nocardioides jishulii]
MSRTRPARQPLERRHRMLAAGVALAFVALVAGCSSTDDGGEKSGGRTATTDVPTRYVALGDSFTAAPFVPNAVEALGCYRSTGNYPSLVARGLRDAAGNGPATELVDVSCSAADTTHMTKPQTTVLQQRVPPQFEALTPETDLVTIGIGGNDFNVFATLTGRCPQLADRDPKGAPCRESLQRGGRDVLTEAVGRTQKRVRTVIEEVRERSPEARILLVNYPQLTPKKGCDNLMLARGDNAYAREVAERLDQALRRAAEATDAELVDLWSASEGHDICSDDPWVNGPETDFSRALQFHPFAEGQQAAADLVLEKLRS